MTDSESEAASAAEAQVNPAEEMATKVVDLTKPESNADSPLKYREQVVRALNLFCGAMARLVATMAGFTQGEAAAFRNLVRLKARDGGKSVKGYYSILPAAATLTKTKDEYGNEVHLISTAKVVALQHATTKVLARLFEVLATKPSQMGQYTHDKVKTQILIPTGNIAELPDEEDYANAWEEAVALATTPGGIEVEDF